MDYNYNIIPLTQIQRTALVYTKVKISHANYRYIVYSLHDQD